MVCVRRRVWLLCALAAAASLLLLRPFQTAEEPAASSLPDVEALRSPCSPKMTRRAPEAFRACFATSHGPFEAHCVRRRAPVWVDRVYNLVANGFYDDQRDCMLSVPRSTLTLTQLWAIAALGLRPLSARACSDASHSPWRHHRHSGAVASPVQSRPPPKPSISRRAPPRHLRPRYFPRVLNGSGLSVVQFGTSGNPTVSNTSP